ncbi:hypothetical protein MKW94_026769, partial [Papaver nudicaule]|nr:hypothetical protein [Papaver nudicaule]
RSNFSPYLIRYAGTAVMAYASPKAYQGYILLNSISFLVCGLTIVLVTFDAIKQRPSLSPASIVGFLEVLLATAVACLGLSYIIAVQTISPPYYGYGQYGTTGSDDQKIRVLITIINAPIAAFIFLQIFSWIRERALRRPWISNTDTLGFVSGRLIGKMVLYYLALWVLFSVYMKSSP